MHIFNELRLFIYDNIHWQVSYAHTCRRTSHGAADCSPPPDSGKIIIFRAKAKFFGQKPAAKNKKNCIY